ncbi:ATP-binding protein [Actinomadura rupiterrae]|uniref:ATP-binding protein n=1 Tax=Actinomadura rupiterrae TaxID=559627 RepID=UPI0020A39931|nr:ATP-binding protein [Actinomadura rupiterrae]MCP2340741.1 anti-sigma regulatory factor (Ser/Thr protein kinase) [Actinomadura rupiterrae]
MNLVGTLDVPGVARSAQLARAFVTRLARRLTLIDVTDETLSDLALVVDELVANACEHTASGRGGRISVFVQTAGRAVRLIVQDDGGALTSRTSSPRRAARADAACGWSRRCPQPGDRTTRASGPSFRAGRVRSCLKNSTRSAEPPRRRRPVDNSARPRPVTASG